jgi:outer membrane protein assembly factor BamB
MRLCAALMWILAILGRLPDIRADWPQFRGPTGDGVAGEAGLPMTWSETENVVWKVPIVGLGRSSPVVLGGRIWLTTAVMKPAAGAKAGANPPDKNVSGSKDDPVASDSGVSLQVLCLAGSSGKVLYQSEVFAVEKAVPIHPVNSHATPTPVIEPGRLYCDFGVYGTACVDAADGRVLWKARLPVEHQLGPASSPVLCRDWMVVVRDGCDAQFVAGLDKHSGRTVWRTPRPPVHAELPVLKKSFSSPLVIEVEGQPQVVTIGPHWVGTYDPATGREIWRVRHGTGYSIAPRPVYGHGMVYVSTGGYVADLLAVRVNGLGDVSQTHVAWKASQQIPLMASPLLVGRELYFVSDNGIASCLDAVSGKMHWRERLGGNYAASPFFADGRIYFVSREGKTTVLKPGTQFLRLAENRLQAAVIATPAISDHAIFLRSDTHLYRIQQR